PLPDLEAADDGPAGQQVRAAHDVQRPGQAEVLGAAVHLHVQLPGDLHVHRLAAQPEVAADADGAGHDHVAQERVRAGRQDLPDRDAGGVDHLVEQRPAELHDVVLPPELVEVERAAVDLERAGDDRPGVLAGEAQLAGAGDLDVTALRGAEAVQTDGEVEARVVQRPERDQPADGCAAGVAPEPDVDAQHAVVQDAEGALHVTIPDAHGLPERARAP